MSGSKSLYFFLLFFFLCVRKIPFGVKILGVSSCMISWDPRQPKIIYITVSYHLSASLKAGHPSYTQLWLIKQKFQKMEKSNLKPQFLHKFCFVIFAMMNWTYRSSLEGLPFPVSPKHWSQHFTGVSGAKKAMSQVSYGSQTHSLVQGLLLTQILFHNE